ncbi:MAG: hypothetical protein AAGC55_02325 [Myxococcota bacterium]
MSSKQPPVLSPALDSSPPTRLRRRDMIGFLAGVAAAAPAAAATTWLTTRSGAPPIAPTEAAPEAEAEPAVAARPSLLAERPRMIFVIPGAYDEQYELGHALGEYLNHGSDEQLAPLAAVHVECVAEDELDLPPPCAGKGPYSVVLAASALTRVVRFDLHEQPHGRAIFAEDGPDGEAAIEDSIDRRIAAVAAAVHVAVAREHVVTSLWPRATAYPRVVEIAEQARRGAPVPGATDYDPVAFMLEGEEDDKRERQLAPVAPSEVDRYAPGLLVVALDSEDRARRDLMALLAARVRTRLVKGIVSGSEWAHSGGCGMTIEGRDSTVMVGCGMGHVPERSQRFLHFYTRSR